MGKQSHKVVKIASIIALIALASCSSSGRNDGTGYGTPSVDTINSIVRRPGSLRVGSAGWREAEAGRREGEAGQVAGQRADRGAGQGTGQGAGQEFRAGDARSQTVFYFDFDIAEFRASDYSALAYHANELAANPRMRIRLEGHADERGTRGYNLALGERRANSISNFLVANGASRSQIEVVSYGEERPARRGQTESAYSLNRRVEIVAY